MVHFMTFYKLDDRCDCIYESREAGFYEILQHTLNDAGRYSCDQNMTHELINKTYMNHNNWYYVVADVFSLFLVFAGFLLNFIIVYTRIDIST